MLAAKSNLQHTLGTVQHHGNQQRAAKVPADPEPGTRLEQVGEWSWWSEHYFIWVSVPESEGWAALAITDLEPASE